jgi:hypothetical protein
MRYNLEVVIMEVERDELVQSDECSINALKSFSNEGFKI